MSEVRRVLMTSDAVGGVFTYAVELAAELARAGARVHLATMGPAPRPEQRARAAAVPGLVLHESTWALEWMDDPWDEVARAGQWLTALERELAPDVVHLNGYVHGALPFSAPTVVVAHSCVLSWWRAVFAEGAPSRYDVYRRAVRAGLDGADAVVAISVAMQAALEREYGAVERASVVYNGVAAEPARALPKEPFVLSSGRVWDRAKNVEALARVAPRLPWPVKVAGWDSDTYDSVEPLGWLAPGELEAQMGRASVFALPAKYEPFGLGPLEAALRGAALVLGDIPSLREVWGDAALFVDPFDDDAIAAAIARVCTDGDLRASLAERARVRAARYPASRMAEETLSVYRAAAQRRRRRACA